jgi:hypothetical protein
MEQGPARIGLLWRGDRRAELPAAPNHPLGSLVEAFEKRSVATESVVYADDAVDEVRQQLFALDGVLVWVNPIQDGVNRAHLDALLREVSLRGVWVSAHPDVILKMGTKEVLFRTRDLGWGSDTELYPTPAEFEENFPPRLGQHGRLVVKQGRGNGGNGVWKVELIQQNAEFHKEVVVRIQNAQLREGSSELTTLGAFMQRCEEDFAWSGCIIDQVFQERLADGMLRCYFSQDQVVGFCHQWPRGLLEMSPEEVAEPPRATVMEGPDTPAYQDLRWRASADWVPQMKYILGIETHALPVVWDADFLYGPKNASGEDTYVLCEINVSAVWPFPPMAADEVASAALASVFRARSNQR